MIFKIAIWVFLAYLLYRFIFEVVLPVRKATKQVKSNFAEMQRRMQEQQAQQQQYARQQQQRQTVQQEPAANPKNDDDYIEFEEVKP